MNPSVQDDPAADNLPNGFVHPCKHDRAKFYRSLPPEKWWAVGAQIGPTIGWLEIYQKNDQQCVYCGMDLFANPRLRSIEHLVPVALVGNREVTAHFLANLELACVFCNLFKNGYVPRLNDPAWQNRAAYIKACQKFVGERRLEILLKFQPQVACLEKTPRTPPSTISKLVVPKRNQSIQRASSPAQKFRHRKPTVDLNLSLDFSRDPSITALMDKAFQRPTRKGQGTVSETFS